MDSSGCDKSGERWEQRGAAERSQWSRTIWVRLGAKRKRPDFLDALNENTAGNLLRVVRQILVERRARGHAGPRQLNGHPRRPLIKATKPGRQRSLTRTVQ